MEEAPKTKVYNPELALQKARAYCAYQERSHQQMRDKLYEWGMWPDAVENIITHLIQENFLSEERFAKAYAGGKFRQSKWGKVKIKQGLKHHRISDYCIKVGLKEIDDQKYVLAIKELIRKKQREIKEKNPIKKQHKIVTYLISRGFEQDIVWELMKQDED